MEMSKKQYEYLLFAVAVTLAVFRFSYFGLRYTPYLDDYIQYIYYPRLENSWQRVYAGGAGVLYTRPLAGLFDLFLWSRFQNDLGVAAGIISILHGMTAVLFYKAFNLCKLKVGAMFLAIYILLPVNVEATYWLSASSRIVVSMFFISLSAYFGANKKAVLFFIFNFISVWFYEQTAILSFVISIWICLRQDRRRWILLPVASVIFLAIFYYKLGFLGDNAQRLSSFNFSGIWQGIVTALNNFLNILLNIQFKLLTRGFARGFTQIAVDFSLFWLVCLTILSILFFVISQCCEMCKSKHYSDFIWGVFFALAPLLPFFVLDENGFNLRNAAPCILGLAIVADRALSGISQKYICVLGAVLVFWFSIVAVSEVKDYNYVAEQDFSLASQIADNISDDTKLARVKVKTPDYYNQNAPYGDHIMSMTGSDWGITGIVRTLSNNEMVVVEKVN